MLRRRLLFYRALGRPASVSRHELSSSLEASLARRLVASSDCLSIMRADEIRERSSCG
jgi:hypothetical protein